MRVVRFSFPHLSLILCVTSLLVLLLSWLLCTLLLLPFRLLPLPPTSPPLPTLRCRLTCLPLPYLGCLLPLPLSLLISSLCLLSLLRCLLLLVIFSLPLLPLLLLLSCRLRPLPFLMALSLLPLLLTLLPGSSVVHGLGAGVPSSFGVPLSPLTRPLLPRLLLPLPLLGRLLPHTHMIRLRLPRLTRLTLLPILSRTRKSVSLMMSLCRLIHPLSLDSARSEYRCMIEYVCGLLPHVAGVPPAAPPPRA